MEKLKKYRLLILVLLVTILFGFSIKKSTTISADEETLPSSSENLRNESTEYSVATDQNKVESSGVKDDAQVELKTEEEVSNHFSFYMKNSDQTREFGATAIPQVISVGDTFNKKPEELVKNIVLPEGHTATFSYVDGKIPFIDNTAPSTSVILKMYMTDNEQPENKVLIKVPLYIMAKGSTLKTAAAQEFTQISIDYADYSAKVTTKEDQMKYLHEKAGIVMWEIETGNPVKAEYGVGGTGSTTLPSGKPAILKAFKDVFIPSNSDRQSLEIRLNYHFRDKVNVVEQDLLKELTSGFINLPYGSKLGTIKNPLNNSEMGIPFRGGLVDNHYSNSESGYTIKDSEGRSVYDFSSTNKYYSYLNNKKLDDIVYSRSERQTWRYYLRKDNMLRQVMVDPQAMLIYVLDARLMKNGYFTEELSIYNTNSIKNAISVYSSSLLNYDGWGGKTFLLGNGAGFYQQKYVTSLRLNFTFKFKNSRGQFLGEQDRYVLGSGREGSPNSKPPIIGNLEVLKNYFGDDFSKTGIENWTYPKDTLIMNGNSDYVQIYQMGASPKVLASGEKLTTKIELYAGTPLPYMLMETTPKEYNVYEDYEEDTKFEYLLSNIPEIGDYGTVTFTYPDDTTEQVEYTADETKAFKGTFAVPRATLPKVLNDISGTIKSYQTDIFAENDRMGVPSEEFAVPINVYNLGAKPIPQLIRKGSIFTKKPEELIKDPVILPGNTADYEYEGELPDTSKVGLTSVLVRMTDKERPEKTTLIKVPVEVTSGTPPTSGLYLAAKDYTGVVQELQGITEDQVAELILKKSEAVAWDVSTGSSEDITLSVTSTTLKPNSPVGTYKASIKAVQGTLTKTKEVTITIVDKQTVKVEFLDEEGEAMREPISLLRTVGTTIDLTKEEEVQAAIKGIKNNRYQIYQRPENESTLVVPNKDITVAYRFEGTLFVSSYPTFMNFGVKALQASTPFIRVEKARYNKPLTIWDNRKGTSPWVLTATLEQALTSFDDDSKILPEAIRYKKDDSTTVILRQGSAEPILTKKSKAAGDVSISDGWDKGDSGLQLEVPTGKVLQAGKYYATILWQVTDTP